MHVSFYSTAVLGFAYNVFLLTSLRLLIKTILSIRLRLLISKMPHAWCYLGACAGPFQVLLYSSLNHICRRTDALIGETN